MTAKNPTDRLAAIPFILDHSLLSEIANDPTQRREVSQAAGDRLGVLEKQEADRLAEQKRQAEAFAENWSQLREGLSVAEVGSLLGPINSEYFSTAVKIAVLSANLEHSPFPSTLHFQNKLYTLVFETRTRLQVSPDHTDPRLVHWELTNSQNEIPQGVRSEVTTNPATALYTRYTAYIRQ
jgi:hypothetical protein